MSEKDKIVAPLTFGHDDLVIEDKTTNYNGFFNVNTLTFRHKLFAGGWSGSVKRELFERGNAVIVLPYDIERDQIVMLEQIRIGCIANSDKPWMLELVGGMVEPGEQNEEVAHRETEEEAGLKLRNLMPMVNYLSSAGGTSERLYLYAGQVDSSKAGDICGLDYEDEDIKVHVVSRQQALQYMNDGVIENAATIIALQWLELNLDKLKNAWR
ncbi:ADP-ribose diphosphatase [Saccharobesus litoralis]|uniref:ADP-ribose pyrophosphatase n=1 Tax=Saccharobesus litoralis TaxID=2172099 RepID=A0A2S0VVD5_9ALTE|nr:ADP-ribose diphosphatase [Saccharobesus litoralis]AWB68181.1 ADP-ribose diphosphatase [Saccharobesus litoralis]